MSIVFILLSCVAIVAALHPYTTFPISLYALAWLREQPSGSVTPKAAERVFAEKRHETELAILLCVYNEERDIRQRVDDLVSQTTLLANTQILIYSDGSDDKTVDILKSYGDQITVLASSERRGKTHGMNALVELAKAEILVFTDATVRMGPQALGNLMEHFKDPTIGCVCGQIIAHDHSAAVLQASGGNNAADTQDSTSAPDTSNSTSTADTTVRSWAFDAAIRRMETRVASVIGAHGPLFAIRRHLHKAVPVDLIDDFYVSISILFDGHRVVQADDVVGFKTVAKRRKDEYDRKVRIACQAYNVHKVIRPALRQQPLLIRYLYASHKTLRWTTIFSLILVAVFGALALISAGYVIFLGWMVGVAALILVPGCLGIKPFNRVIDALLPFIANGMGIIKSLQGHKYQTWASPASAREGTQSVPEY